MIRAPGISRRHSACWSKVASILAVLESFRRVEVFVAGYPAARILVGRSQNRLPVKLLMTGVFDRSANNSRNADSASVMTAIDPASGNG
jgi:hypothetical protein